VELSELEAPELNALDPALQPARVAVRMRPTESATTAVRVKRCCVMQ